MPKLEPLHKMAEMDSATSVKLADLVSDDQKPASTQLYFTLVLVANDRALDNIQRAGAGKGLVACQPTATSRFVGTPDVRVGAHRTMGQNRIQSGLVISGMQEKRSTERSPQHAQSSLGRQQAPERTRRHPEVGSSTDVDADSKTNNSKPAGKESGSGKGKSKKDKNKQGEDYMCDANMKYSEKKAHPKSECRKLTQDKRVGAEPWQATELPRKRVAKCCSMLMMDSVAALNECTHERAVRVPIRALLNTNWERVCPESMLHITVGELWAARCAVETPRRSLLWLRISRICCARSWDSGMLSSRCAHMGVVWQSDPSGRMTTRVLPVELTETQRGASDAKLCAVPSPDFDAQSVEQMAINELGEKNKRVKAKRIPGEPDDDERMVHELTCLRRGTKAAQREVGKTIRTLARDAHLDGSLRHLAVGSDKRPIDFVVTALGWLLQRTWPRREP